MTVVESLRFHYIPRLEARFYSCSISRRPVLHGLAFHPSAARVLVCLHDQEQASERIETQALYMSHTPPFGRFEVCSLSILNLEPDGYFLRPPPSIALTVFPENLTTLHRTVIMMADGSELS